MHEMVTRDRVRGFSKLNPSFRIAQILQIRPAKYLLLKENAPRTALAVTMRGASCDSTSDEGRRRRESLRSR
jgi:hypothetical protein